MVEALGAVPATHDRAAAPARAGGDQVKPDSGLQPPRIPGMAEQIQNLL